ncbi:MAG: hypothetical protein JXM69_08680 [Anaerolineae bacterium]|nr:hypothetical protein [Anaerolineae bacterium]
MNKHLNPTWFVMVMIIWPLLACLIGAPGTAIPPERPANFEIQTATPTLDPRRVTPPVEEKAEAAILPLSDAPTHTPDPRAQPTPPPSSPTPLPITQAPTLEITPTAELTQAVTVAPAPLPITPDPPLQGGEWDFETDFIPWPNPYGEPCPGAAVASGWTAFVEQGPYGSSCMNENLYQPNVFSGLKSQEITFDFISANSGVFRTIPTQPGHRYSIVAYAKHDHSLSPVNMALGIDLTGGNVWTAETVQWFAWDSASEDTWLETEETITATGEQMTIFIKGFHPMAEQGGKTVIDNVSVTHLGP